MDPRDTRIENFPLPIISHELAGSRHLRRAEKERGGPLRNSWTREGVDALGDETLGRSPRSVPLSRKGDLALRRGDPGLEPATRDRSGRRPRGLRHALSPGLRSLRPGLTPQHTSPRPPPPYPAPGYPPPAWALHSATPGLGAAQRAGHTSVTHRCRPHRHRLRPS